MGLYLSMTRFLTGVAQLKKEKGEYQCQYNVPNPIVAHNTLIKKYLQFLEEFEGEFPPFSLFGGAGRIICDLAF